MSHVTHSHYADHDIYEKESCHAYAIEHHVVYRSEPYRADGVATMSRLLKMIGLVCRIASVL